MAFSEVPLNPSLPPSSNIKISGEYLFFIDCDGHILDEKLQLCLKKIEDECLYYKFLGSYPKGKVI